MPLSAPRLLKAVCISALVVTGGSVSAQTAPAEPPAPAAAPTPILDLGVPDPPPPEVFMSFVAWRAKTPDERESCQRLVDAWAHEEEGAQKREFEPLRQQTARITEGGTYRWADDAWRRALLIEVAPLRNRACARMVEREEALVRGLAAVVGEQPDDAPWQVLTALLEARRNARIVTSFGFAGGRLNLSDELGYLVADGKPPFGDEALDQARRDYLRSMLPLWVSRRTVYEGILGKTITVESPVPPRKREYQAQLARATEAVQVANDLWARRFGAVVGGERGERLANRLLDDLYPESGLRWHCQFESAISCSKSCSDPDTVRRVLENWKQRCDVIRDVYREQDREWNLRAMSGRGVRSAEADGRFAAVARALSEEAVVHLSILLDGLGCELADDACLAALESLPETRVELEIADSNSNRRFE